jgi:hypothetical protein
VIANPVNTGASTGVIEKLPEVDPFNVKVAFCATVTRGVVNNASPVYCPGAMETVVDDRSNASVDESKN